MKRRNAPHGLCLSVGVCHIISPDMQTISDYKAALDFTGYGFVSHTVAHANIQTPAQAIGWTKIRVPFPNVSTTRYAMHAQSTWWKPRGWMCTWLDENAPGWALQHPHIDTHQITPVIFFAKPSHGRALIARLTELLDGANPILNAKDRQKA